MQDIIIAVTGLFILGMVWLRTRMQYVQRGGGALRLEPAGHLYFGSVLALLVLGWFVAPPIGRTLWPGTAATPTLMRVTWYLATYYLFIIVHRVLRGRGAAVFTPRDQSSFQPPSAL